MESSPYSTVFSFFWPTKADASGDGRLSYEELEAALQEFGSSCSFATSTTCCNLPMIEKKIKAQALASQMILISACLSGCLDHSINCQPFFSDLNHSSDAIRSLELRRGSKPLSWRSTSLGSKCS